MPQQVKQAKAPRKISQEVRLVQRALKRIASHPVVSARKIAVMQIEAECLRVFPNKD